MVASGFVFVVLGDAFQTECVRTVRRAKCESRSDIAYVVPESEQRTPNLGHFIRVLWGSVSHDTPAR